MIARVADRFAPRRSIERHRRHTVEAMNAFRAFPVAVTSLGFAVVQLDVTIVNVALPRIGTELGAPLAWLQWVVDAYTLSFAALLLTAGALADRLVSRACYAAGLATFALASCACGLSRNIAWLVAARVLQGVGAALLVPSSLALLNAAHGSDVAARARAVGFWTAAGGVSIAAGPIVGGALLEVFGWQSIFFVNAPICAVAGLLALRGLADSPRQRSSHALDVPGQVAIVVALTALVGTIIEAPALAPAHPGWIVGGFMIALVGAGVFCRVEARAASPMLPLAFFARSAFSRAILFGIVANLTYYGIVFVLSLYLQQARSYSTIDAGLAYLPLTATFIVSNVASGAITARRGTRLPMVAGAIIGAVGFALLVPLDATSPFIEMLPGFALIPFGMGLAVPAMTTSMLGSVEPRFAGTAAGALNASRQAGGALGVALFGALAASVPIVTALQRAASISAGLMIAAALLVLMRRRCALAATGVPSTDVRPS
jgi:DHA2 family methylenomycin A resistance protein-like MFS transporter